MWSVAMETDPRFVEGWHMLIGQFEGLGQPSSEIARVAGVDAMREMLKAKN